MPRLGSANPRQVTSIVRKVRSDALSVLLTYLDTARGLLMYFLRWLTGELMLDATVRTIYDLSQQRLLQVIADWTLSGILASFITFAHSNLGLKDIALALLMSRYVPAKHIAVVSAILTRLLTVVYSLWRRLAQSECQA